VMIVKLACFTRQFDPALIHATVSRDPARSALYATAPRHG
jgi:hypothetical protein